MATIDEEVALLRRVPLFARVDQLKLKLLALASGRIVFESGNILFRQGDDGDAAYAIISGTAEILVEGPDGLIPINKSGPGEIIGELAIVCEVPRSATVRATSRLDTLCIGKQEFLQLLHDTPEIGIEVIKVLGFRLLSMTTEVTRLRRGLDGGQARSAEGPGVA